MGSTAVSPPCDSFELHRDGGGGGSTASLMRFSKKNFLKSRRANTGRTAIDLSSLIVFLFLASYDKNN
jgi:hypothetical protein